MIDKDTKNIADQIWEALRDDRIDPLYFNQCLIRWIGWGNNSELYEILKTEDLLNVFIDPE
jgi:hypothetical protein|tara:strand:- start:408 stop:590 length:183 start_codon:yes stop_codon:yes gene_type:complete